MSDVHGGLINWLNVHLRSWRLRSASVRTVLVVALIGSWLCVSANIASASLAVTVVNTGGQGVASRSAPSLAATNGYGAPEGAAVTAVCWTWGDAVGPYANRLWWQVTYAGRQFFAADRYLSTPNAANQPPAGQPQCGASSPAPAPSSGTDPSVWVGSPIDGKWSSYESGNTHHLLGKANPQNDWAVDLEGAAGQDVILYAAPQDSNVVVNARIDTITNGACMNGNGGSFVTVGFYAAAGNRIGSATYAHINPSVAVGQNVGRWGSKLGVIGSYTVDQACWTGPHVHVEMYSTHHYACYNGSFGLGVRINRTNFVGYTGGDRASAAHQACP